MLLKLALLAPLCVLISAIQEERNQQSEDDLLIATFNIQVLGKTKVNKKEAVNVLCQILGRHDLVGVLEIGDSSQTAFPELVQSLNEHVGGEVFEFFTGRRTGRTSSKEQTGFIYRTSKLDVVSMYERNDPPKRNQQSEDDLLIATFNIQVLGKTKVNKKEVVDVLCQILGRYDLVGVLEIRDSSQTAFPELVQSLNEHVGGEVFEFFTGRRTGRTSSKEQTGFIYRTSKLDVVSMYERNDPYDVLEREPTVARFRRTQPGGFIREFTFIPIHIKPDDAVNEINNLLDVCDEAERVYGENIIVAGDLNADCRYVRKSDWDDCKLKQSADYYWMISDEEDTTTKATDCAYDRIILRGKNIREYSCCAKVYRFDIDMGIQQELVEDVSDHYPVEFILS